MSDDASLRAERPYQDGQLLRKLYVDEELSIREISEEIGCPYSTVRDWMERHGIERRSTSEAKCLASPGHRHNVPIRINEAGYVRWRISVDGQDSSVYVHRLLAIAEYGFDAVCDKAVHHINEVPWDNRPENITLLDIGAHSRHHKMKFVGDRRRQIADLYEFTDGSQGAIAEFFDISKTAVGEMHSECHDTPAGDGTVYQGHACTSCGDRIKFGRVAVDEPYEVPRDDDGGAVCSEECRREDHRGPVDP